MNLAWIELVRLNFTGNFKVRYNILIYLKILHCILVHIFVVIKYFIIYPSVLKFNSI